MSTCPSCGEFFDEDNESQHGFCGHCGEYQYDYDESTPEERKEMQQAYERRQKDEENRREAFRAGVLSGIDRTKVSAALFLDEVLVEDIDAGRFDDGEEWQAVNALEMAQNIQRLLRQPAEKAATQQDNERHYSDWIERMVYASSPPLPFPAVEDGGFSEVRPVQVKTRFFQGDEYCDAYLVRCYGFMLTSNQYRSDLELRAELGERLLVMYVANLDKSRCEAEAQRVRAGFPPIPHPSVVDNDLPF